MIFTLRSRLTLVYTAVFGLLLVAIAVVSYRVLAYQLDSDMTGALLLGAGVELFQSSHFAFSLEARTLIASFDDVDEGTTVATNVLFGLQWW